LKSGDGSAVQTGEQNVGKESRFHTHKGPTQTCRRQARL